MDLQTRKLNIIEYLIGLKDEDLLRVIEELIHKTRFDTRQNPIKMNGPKRKTGG